VLCRAPFEQTATWAWLSLMPCSAASNLNADKRAIDL
jgi:hypothetical protein